MSEQYTLKVILEAQDKLSPALYKVTGQITKTNTVLGNLKKIAMESLSFGIGYLGVNSLEKAKRSLEDSIVGFAELEQKLKTIKVFAGEWNISLRDMMKRLFAISNVTQRSIDELAESMIELAKTGVVGEKAFKVLKASATGATAAGERLDGVVNTLVSTLIAFKINVDDAGRVMDILVNAANEAQMSVSDFQTALAYIGPFAKQVGMSLEDVVTTITLLNRAGFDASQAGTYLRQAISNLIDPTKEAVKTMQKLGINIYDAQGKLKSFPEIIEEFREKLRGLSSAEIMEVLTKIFDVRSASAMATLLQYNVDEWDSLKDKIVEVGTAQRQAEEMMNTTQGALVKIHNAVQELSLSFGEALAPSIVETADSLTKFIQENKDDIIGMFKTLGDVIKETIHDLHEFISVLREVRNNIAPFGEEYSNMLDTLHKKLDEFRNHYKGFLDLNKKDTDDFVKFINNLFMGPGGWITNLSKIPSMFKTISEVYKAVIKEMMEYTVNFIERIKKTFEGLGSGITNIFKQLYDKLVGHSIIPDMVRESLDWFKKLEEGANLTIEPIIEPQNKKGVYTHGILEGGSKTINVNITIENASLQSYEDINRLAEIISYKLQQEVYRNGGV